MTLDAGRIEERIQLIKDNLALLNELANYAEADFVGDKRNLYAAAHALQVSVDAMLDTFTHVISRLHLGAPKNDREVLEVALKKGLTSEAHFRKFVEMNKFRNKVVHGYMDVDAKTVYKMLHEDLGDFDLFFADVKRIIEKEQTRENNSNRKANRNK